MSSKILPLIFAFLISICWGCGGATVTPSVVHAADAFPPAQALTCHGNATDPGGMICDSSDGEHLYQHYQWSVAVRPDGHGTFAAITETGTRQNNGTFELIFQLPRTVNVNEVHGTLSLTSWCNDNGLATTWQGAAPHGPVENIVAGKTFTFKTGDTANFAINQVVFPQPVPLSELYLYINNDLCASSTVHWTLNGSF